MCRTVELGLRLKNTKQQLLKQYMDEKLTATTVVPPEAGRRLSPRVGPHECDLRNIQIFFWWIWGAKAAAEA